MFKNAGKNLGTWLRICAIISMVLSVIAGLVSMAILIEEVGGLGFIIGVLATVGALLAIWLGSLFMIGLCDMMYDVRTIRRTLCSGEVSNDRGNGVNSNSSTNAKLEELRQKGLITEEEYWQGVNK